MANASDTPLPVVLFSENVAKSQVKAATVIAQLPLIAGAPTVCAQASALEAARREVDALRRRAAASAEALEAARGELASKGASLDEARARLIRTGAQRAEEFQQREAALQVAPSIPQYVRAPNADSTWHQPHWWSPCALSCW